MRGSDIEYNPVFFAYLIITMDKIIMFVNQAKLPSNYADHLEANQVKIELLNYEDIRSRLSTLVSYKNIFERHVILNVIINLHLGSITNLSCVDKLIVKLCIDFVDPIK